MLNLSYTLNGMSGKYLKPEQYYRDLYDRHTVELCRDLVRIHSKPIKNPPLYKGQKPSKKLVETVSQMGLAWSLMFEKGHRYIEKENTIARWISKAEERDQLYESAESLEGIHCLTCRSVMKVGNKTLMTDLEKPDRILFMFDCPNDCRPSRAFYDNGEEWKPKPHLCPKCRSELDSKDTVTKSKFIIHYRCSSCGFTKTDEIKRTVPAKEKPDPNFEADRTKYCLSKEEGEKWRGELVRMEGMKQFVEKFKEREDNKELYDRVSKIKKLTVIELEKLLAPALEKGGYIQLRFANPEIDKNVIVPFTTQDSKSGRESRASEYDLKRLIKKTLDDTNWRLMTDGVSYRLGVLSGRLRGYESEEDLVKLARN